MTLVAQSAPEVRQIQALVEPTPTLRFLAGEHAARVARLWAPPHGAYLEMPAQRRHLTHIVLALGAVAEADEHALARALEGERGDAVARRYIGEPPVGFVRALARLGEAAWTGEDYLRLYGLFSGVGGAALLQTQAITPDLVQAIDRMPAALRVHAIARHVVGVRPAAWLDEAWRGLHAVRGETAAASAVARWVRATGPERLFAMAAQDMAPQRFDPAPVPVHPDMRRLGGTTALEEAGRRFRNCLATYGDRAALGTVAIYEWAGPPPGAFSFARDGFFGWRLEEARGVANTLFDAEGRAAAIVAVRAEGVRVGRSGGDIRAALRELAGLDHDWVNPADPTMAAFGVYEDL